MPRCLNEIFGSKLRPDASQNMFGVFHPMHVQLRVFSYVRTHQGMNSGADGISLTRGTSLTRVLILLV
jgi:hypothetical protein